MLRTMTVTAISGDTVTCTAGGDEIPNVPYPNWYTPLVGDVVRLLWDETNSNPFVIFAATP